MRTIGLLLMGLMAMSLVAISGEVLTNDTGEDARGLRVTFSSPVMITRYGDALTRVDPEMLSYEFVFTGGVVEPWGSQWMNWAPVTASIVVHEWLATIDGLGMGQSMPEWMGIANYSEDDNQSIGEVFEHVAPDGQVSAEGIPNLGIQSERLRMKYSTFLELLRRNTGNETRSVDDPASIYGDIDSIYHGWGGRITVRVPSLSWSHEDEWTREVFQELNGLIGREVFAVTSTTSSAAWALDFSGIGWDRPCEVHCNLTVSGNGTPQTCVFEVGGLFASENDFKTRIRNSISEAILLYRDFDPDLIDLLGYDDKLFPISQFSRDLANMICVLADIDGEWDFSLDRNEVNQAPIARITAPTTTFVGEPVRLQSSGSVDPDGEIVDAHWSQAFPSKLDSSYVTTEILELVRTEEQGVEFVAAWPGRYRIILSVLDDRGATGTMEQDIDVVWRDNPLPHYRGVSTGGYVDSNLFDYQTFFSWFTDRNVNSIVLIPVWYMDPDDPSRIRAMASDGSDLPNGITISDSRLRELIRRAHARGLEVVLNPLLEFDGCSSPRGSLEPSSWSAWFDSYSEFILHYAEIAQRESVELFSVGVELNRAENQTRAWRDLISEVRGEYDGPITYQTGAFVWGESQVEFWDDLDYIGISFYLSGTGDQSFGTGKLDPSPLEMAGNLDALFDERIEPVYRQYQKPILFMEVGCTIIDGANQVPWATPPWLSLSDVPAEPSFDYTEQANYYEAVLRFALDEDWFAGLFWWCHSFMSDYNYHSHVIPLGIDPRERPAAEVIRLWYE